MKLFSLPLQMLVPFVGWAKAMGVDSLMLTSSLRERDVDGPLKTFSTVPSQSFQTWAGYNLGVLRHHQFVLISRHKTASLTWEKGIELSLEVPRSIKNPRSRTRSLCTVSSLILVARFLDIFYPFLLSLMYLFALHHRSLCLVTCSVSVIDYMMRGCKDEDTPQETKIMSPVARGSDEEGGGAASWGSERQWDHGV